MKIKKLITLIEMLSLTGLISVGFSSWLVIHTDFKTAGGTIIAEEVINYNDYIKVKNVTMSDASDTGFVLDSTIGNSTNKGYLSADIEISLAPFSGLVDNIPVSLVVTQTIISGKGYRVIGNSSISLVDSYSYSYDNIKFTNVSSENIESLDVVEKSNVGFNYYYRNGKKINVTKNVSNYLYLKMEYQFTFSGDSYKNFYTHVSNGNGYNFTISAQIEMEE